jgi:hypothetical protein
MVDDDATTPPLPPQPAWTPRPYTNGHDREPPSGVFDMRTGRTRRYVKWGSIIAAATSLLMPVMNAIAARIAPPQQVVLVAPSRPDGGQ